MAADSEMSICSEMLSPIIGISQIEFWALGKTMAI